VAIHREVEGGGEGGGQRLAKIKEGEERREERVGLGLALPVANFREGWRKGKRDSIAAFVFTGGKGRGRGEGEALSSLHNSISTMRISTPEKVGRKRKRRTEFGGEKGRGKRLNRATPSLLSPTFLFLEENIAKWNSA